jgi:hypothetical protein
LCFLHLLFLCSSYFFSFDLDFLCVDVFEFILLTDNARSDRAVGRRVEILRFPLLLECVFCLEAFDDVDNTAPSHQFSDGGPDSPRLAWHHPEIFFWFHRHSFYWWVFEDRVHGLLR